MARHQSVQTRKQASCFSSTSPPSLVVLVAVVVKGAGTLRRTVLAEPGVELRDVDLHRLGIEGIEHVARAARTAAFHLHTRTRRVVLVNPRSAETPAGPHRQVDAETVPTRRPRRQVPGVDPLGRQQGLPLRAIDVVGSVRPVNRNHVKAAEALLGEFAALVLKPRRVDGGPHPPVVYPRLHFAGRVRPGRQFTGKRRCDGCKKERQNGKISFHHGTLYHKRKDPCPPQSGTDAGLGR